MSLISKIETLTPDRLQEIGSKKWSTTPGVIGSTVAEMDFGVSEQIADALRSLLDEGLVSYLPAQRRNDMVNACAGWLRDSYDWEVDAESIRPLPDVLRGLEAVITHFTSPGASVILPTPTHVPFLSVPGQLGRRVVEVPMIEEEDLAYRLDLDGIDAAFAAGAELLVLCSPHNPIGKVYSRAELDALAQIVDGHGGRVFSDEIHSPLVFPDHEHVPYPTVSATAASHAITATSASKGWNLSGLKCAQLILSNEADAQRWSEIGFLSEHGAGLFGAVASAAAYEHSRDWLAQVIDYLDESRRLAGELIARHLPGVRYRPPEGTYLAWLDCRGIGKGDEAADFFNQQAGVAVNDGAGCGRAGRGHVRLNLATSHAILSETIERMGDALAGEG